MVFDVRLVQWSGRSPINWIFDDRVFGANIHCTTACSFSEPNTGYYGKKERADKTGLMVLCKHCSVHSVIACHSHDAHKSNWHGQAEDEHCLAGPNVVTWCIHELHGRTAMAQTVAYGLV